MKNIYFDHQIFVDFYDNRPNKINLMGIDKNRFKVFYSPAHCEEICNGLLKGVYDIDEKNRRLNILSVITGNNEVLPPHSPVKKIQSRPFGMNGINFAKESPHDCFKRVIDFIDSNAHAEESQKIILQQAKNKLSHLSERDRGIEIHRIRSSNPVEDILEKDEVIESMILAFIELLSHSHAMDIALMRGTKIQPFTEEIKEKILSDAAFLRHYLHNEYTLFSRKIFKNPKEYHSKIARRHSTAQELIDVLLRTLARENYHHDRESRFSASLHDHSHAIYGSYFDYFITHDRELSKRVEATYKFLGLDTKVIYSGSNNWFEILA